MLVRARARGSIANNKIKGLKARESVLMSRTIDSTENDGICPHPLWYIVNTPHLSALSVPVVFYGQAAAL